MSDQHITCSECGGSFVFTESERQFYETKGLAGPPKRCKACRQARKAAAGEGGRGAGGGAGGAARTPGRGTGGGWGRVGESGAARPSRSFEGRSFEGRSFNAGAGGRAAGRGAGPRGADARGVGPRDHDSFGPGARGTDSRGPGTRRPGDAPANEPRAFRGPEGIARGPASFARPRHGDPARDLDGRTRSDAQARAHAPANGDASRPRRAVFEAPRDRFRPRAERAPRAAALAPAKRPADESAADGHTPRAKKKKPDRPKFDVTCNTCGTAAQVPFKPIEGREIFCQPCYQARRGIVAPTTPTDSPLEPGAQPRIESGAFEAGENVPLAPESAARDEAWPAEPAAERPEHAAKATLD